MTGIVNKTGSKSGVVGTITTAAAEAGGKHTSTQVFTGGNTQTWTKPAGITNIFVELVAAGGGGCGHTESGAGGGYASEWIDVYPPPAPDSVWPHPPPPAATNSTNIFVIPAGLVHVWVFPPVKTCVDVCLPPASAAAVVIVPTTPDLDPVLFTIPVI
jgi:hypothetical protein